MRPRPTNEEVLEKYLEMLKRLRFPVLGTCDGCGRLLIKRGPRHRFHTQCGRYKTAKKAGQRRIRRMRLSQVNLVCDLLEGFQSDKKGTWQEEAEKKLIERGDQESQES